MSAVRHTAGAYVAGVQRCSGCAALVLDRRDEMAPAGTRDRGGWAEGARVVIDGGHSYVDEPPFELSVPDCVEAVQ